MPSHLALAEAIREVLLKGAEAPRRQVLALPGGKLPGEALALGKLVGVEPPKLRLKHRGWALGLPSRPWGGRVA
ncbi:hypothetical protein TthTF19_13850 [Thermus thermophilus]|uniref:hypothetical protein n=1 Tax=Thermus thermophilus TaxID=274 RepID=UPI0032513B11